MVLIRRFDGRFFYLQAVCSLAHHDAKIRLYSPEYPMLSAVDRAANPPRRVPVVLRHPITGIEALYGLNSATFAVLPKRAPDLAGTAARRFPAQFPPF